MADLVPEKAVLETGWVVAGPSQAEDRPARVFWGHNGGDKRGGWQWDEGWESGQDEPRTPS